jgi:GntR family transcriptional regulator
MPAPAKIRIDLNSPVPAYRQIVDAIRVFLVEGVLVPGAALPSVRRLAMELGVHFNTVGEAYRTLADEGWLHLHHGRSAVVLDRAQRASAPPERLQEFRDRLRGLVAQMRAEGVPVARIAAELKNVTEGLKP